MTSQISFYRYVRYHEFDPVRGELRVNPNGGVALGFIRHDNYLQFVFTRCHLEDRFSKLTAKNRLEARARAINLRGEKYFHACGPIEDHQDIMILLSEIFRIEKTFIPDEKDKTDVELKKYLTECVNQIKRIREHNAKEHAKYNEWIQLRRALDFKSLYAKGLPAVMSID